MGNSKKLYRSRRDKVIGGVAGGLADYFEIDVVIIRLLFVLVFFLGGGGLLAYIIMWIVIPAEPYYPPYHEAAPRPEPNPGSTQQPDTEGSDSSNPNATTSEPVRSDHRKNNTGLVAGVVLIVLGFVFLANHMVPWFHLSNFWPVLLIIAGIFIIEPELFNSKK
jgi:phage shock protein PspC (stress-responsive transcriptional regulator)